MSFLMRITAALGFLLIGWTVIPAPLFAADFDVNVEFHINTQRYTYDEIMKWLQTNIETAESLYSNSPALDIHPTFVQENHPRIKVQIDSNGKKFSYLGFDNASDLQKFMEDNFDNQARTKTEGHLTVLVVDEVVKNENKDKGLCGRATFPHWVNPFSRKLGIIMATCNAVASNPGDFVEKYLLAHEIGHFFSLKHTFEPYVNLNPFSVSNCNKDFGNHIKCNSCQGQAKPNSDGDLRWCDGTSNVMDYCTSQKSSEVLNACQLNRAARQREHYQTRDGKTDYQAMAGLRGEGACEADSDCEADEFCTAGILNLARNICKPKLDKGTVCTNKRQCDSDRCSFGVCADPDECRADSDCGAGEYCGDPISGKRTCKTKLADGALCTKDDQCQAGRCKTGFCSAPASASMGESCRFEDECRVGKCNAPVGGATKGTCVCDRDADCGAGFWCDEGFDVKANACRAKLDKGESCGKAGSVGNDHKCKSGECSGLVGGYKCK
ncbi:MAG TPA: Dickkopf N-terminal cysteine-rich domain-containing protein [Nitrospiraceae bacterium]|nr:Dickkopf N-terminal cysteine-rich domain-containing protein [Nitrospiraceae bacterium]